MSSAPNTIDDNKLTNGTFEAAITNIHINGAVNHICKHENAEDAPICVNAHNDEQNKILETYLQPAAEYQLIVILDATTDETNNSTHVERILSLTPKVNSVGGNNVSVVKLNSYDSSVNFVRFDKACSLEVTGAQYTNFDENFSNGQCDADVTQCAFFSDNDEVVVNLGKANHTVRLNDFISFLFVNSIRE